MSNKDIQDISQDVNDCMKRAVGHLHRDQHGECIKEMMKTIDMLCKSNKEMSDYLFKSDYLEEFQLNLAQYLMDGFDQRYEKSREYLIRQQGVSCG